MRLACDTFLIVTQEAFYRYPTRYCLLHSPQHSWGIRFFIQRFKEDMIDRMHQLQKDIENKIEVSNKETREELNGKLNQPLENRVKEKPKSYSWEDEE